MHCQEQILLLTGEHETQDVHHHRVPVKSFGSDLRLTQPELSSAGPACGSPGGRAAVRGGGHGVAVGWPCGGHGGGHGGGREVAMGVAVWWPWGWPFCQMLKVQ